jgi:hypothetical protein
LLAAATAGTVAANSSELSAALFGTKQLIAITTHLLHGNSDEKPETYLHLSQI